MKQKRGRPKKSSLPKFPTVSLELHQETRQSLAIIFFLFLAILTGLSLMNISGSLGELAAQGLRYAFGWGAFLLPLFFTLVSFALYRDLNEDHDREDNSSTHSYIGVTLLSLVAISFLQLVASTNPEEQFAIARLGEGGGIVGASIIYLTLRTIGTIASFILLLMAAVASLLVTFNVPLHDLLASLKPERKTKNAIEEKAPSANIKINDLAKNGFKVESVSKANPVAANLSKGLIKKDPKFATVSVKPVDQETSAPTPTPATPRQNRTWNFPPVNLLDQSNSTVDSGNIEANVAIIQKTLSDFDIEVEMGEVNVGPTVTQYTLRPTEGVRLAAILALQNDLKLALAAPSIRVEAPIPGRSLVGIEIPNKTTAIVRLREMFDTDEFQKHSSAISFVLGRDVAGKAVMEDLAKMPHLLIAGSTGSGKSVCMNVLLTSFLMRSSPDDVKFILIDPKRVEMSLYNDIPHLMTPVITDHQKAVNALKWTVAEMDRRYQLLAEAQKRNIGEYNEIAPDPLSYLVVIVDELADLMTLAKNEVEVAIVRLAQMARAVGIHLVLATQRPSVDIITGLIKANVTSRVAFSVASQTDSRTILDQSGAEKLLGRGDMLYVTSEMSQPRRIQGALISEKEVKKVTDFLRKEGAPSYNEAVTEKTRTGSGEHSFSEGDDDDPLVEEARAIIIETGKASASFLQRRMRVGYARAARMLDILEEQGVIGPAEGSKPREVYGNPVSDEIFAEISEDETSTPNS